MEITTTARHHFEKCALDIVGPLTETVSGNKYILTFQDDLSKFVIGISILQQDDLSKFVIGIPILQQDDLSKFVIGIPIPQQDDLSKFVIGIPIPQQDAETIAKEFVLNVVLKFGAPAQILTDQESNFLSDLFKTCVKC